MSFVGTGSLNGMTHAPSWFDITATDAAASRRFYGELFGWNIQVDETMDYGIVAANPDTPTGGIGQAGAGSRFGVGLVIYFPVDDVDASLELAEKLGGTRVVNPWEIPGLGRMAVFADLDGNNVGLMQA